MEDNEDEVLDSYPTGCYVVVQGSIIGGFKFWGPFASVREAVNWADKFQPFLGFVSIASVESIDKFPVGINEETL